MNSKKLIIYIIIAALVATGGYFIYNGQNSDSVMDDDKMTEDVKDMDNEDMKDDDMDKDEDMKDNDKDMDENKDMDEDKEDMTDESMEDKMMNEGEAAPGFTLMSVDGMEYTLADLEGEKVYVKFWASWCSICLAGLDDVDELSANDDFKVLTIVSPGANGEKDREDFIEWFSSLEMENMTVLLDDEGVITSEYKVRAYPTSAYIGSDGVLVKTLPGHEDNEAIKESVEGIY